MSEQKERNPEITFQESGKEGFGCGTSGCNNREATVGLPYCNENMICMKKNLEYVIAENLKQKGAISVYERLTSKEDSDNELQDMDISPVLNRERNNEKQKREKQLSISY